MMQHTPTPTPTPEPNCPPPPPQPWPTVTFTVTLKEEQPSQWHMIYNGTDYGPTEYPTLSIPCNNTGVFNYTISQGANFAPDKGGKIEAIGIVGGNAKPLHAGVANGLIKVTSHSNTALSFTDANSTPAPNKLNYILYFNNNSQLDPIIQNGGCCNVTGPGESNSSFLQSTAFMIAVVVLAVLVLGYVGYRMFAAKPPVE